jgi:hypothetical protein
VPSKLDELLAEQHDEGPPPSRRIPAKAYVASAAAVSVLGAATGRLSLALGALAAVAIAALLVVLIRALVPELAQWYWDTFGEALSGRPHPRRDVRTAVVFLAGIVVVPVGLLIGLLIDAISNPRSRASGDPLLTVLDVALDAEEAIARNDFFEGSGAPAGEDKAP